MIGYNYHLRLVTDDVKVSAVSSLNINASSSSPRYRGTNLECILLDSKIRNECDAGVLADNDGTVRGFWLSYLGESDEKTYKMGLDVTDVKEVILQLQQNKVPKDMRILDAEFTSLTVLQGRTRGVSELD